VGLSVIDANPEADPRIGEADAATAEVEAAPADAAAELLPRVASEAAFGEAVGPAVDGTPEGRAVRRPKRTAEPVRDATAAPPPPDLGEPPGPILSTDSLATAGRKAMWTHVDRLLKHEAAMRDPSKADELRRYRVATRRLRAAIRLFGPAFKPSDVEPLADGLADVADAVGLVRDLDVRIAAVGEWALARGPESVAGVQPLITIWQAERRTAMTVLERRLASHRHARWLARLADFVVRVAPASAERPGRVVRDRAGSQVLRAYERVRAFAPTVRWADAAALHRLRIQSKRLRYSLEFLADVLGPDKPWLVERLVALQDHLGALNDATVTAAAVRDFLEGHQLQLDPAQRAETVAYLDDREREARRLLRGVGRPWRAIVGVTFARRLARSAIVS
jgi:CHAD domain-containing protein